MFKHFIIVTFFLFPFSGRDKPKNSTVFLGPRALPQSNMAQHLHGDENLHKFQDTDLTGTFTLSIKNGSIVGTLYAIMLEDGGDRTKFLINQDYLIYSPPADSAIEQFKVIYSIYNTSSFHFRQRNFAPQSDVCLTGPLASFDWDGDTNSDQDQIHSVYIIPHIKRLLISLAPLPKSK